MSAEYRNYIPFDSHHPPPLIGTLDHLKDRHPRPVFIGPEEPPTYYPDVHSYVLTTLDSHIRTTYPGWAVTSPFKVFAERRHGQTVETEVHGFLSPAGCFLDLEGYRSLAERRYQITAHTTVSGVVFICPEVNSLNPGMSPLEINPFEEYEPLMVQPLLDLEITASGDPEADLKRVMQIFTNDGLTGFFLQSGDIGKGSYYYAADYLLSYHPWFWKIMGYFMTRLVDTRSGPAGYQNLDNSIELGTALLASDNLEQARGIAQEIRKRFPSIPSGKIRPGLSFDPRWIAHRITQGLNSLRSDIAKDYKELPRLVAELY